MFLQLQDMISNALDKYYWLVPNIYSVFSWHTQEVKVCIGTNNGLLPSYTFFYFYSWTLQNNNKHHLILVRVNLTSLTIPISGITRGQWQ